MDRVRHDAQLLVPVGRDLVHESGRDGVQGGLCRRDLHRGLHASQEQGAPGGAALGSLRALDIGEDHEHLRAGPADPAVEPLVEEPKVGWKDADDPGGEPRHAHRTLQDRGVGSECADPEAVRDHDHLGTALLGGIRRRLPERELVVRREVPPQERLDSQRLHVAPRHPERPDVHGTRVVVRQGDGAHLSQAELDALEDVLGGAKRRQVVPGNHEAPVLAGQVRDVDEAIRLGIRKGAQHDRVHDRKHRGGRADSQRQRDDGQEGEDRLPS